LKHISDKVSSFIFSAGIPVLPSSAPGLSFQEGDGDMPVQLQQHNPGRQAQQGSLRQVHGFQKISHCVGSSFSLIFSMFKKFWFLFLHSLLTVGYLYTFVVVHNQNYISFVSVSC
jgi:hypothetical protein